MGGADNRFVFLMLVALLCPPLLSRASDTATPVRQADAVCSQCHAAIFNSYLQTPMANASGVASEDLIPGALLHANSAMRYEISVDSAGAWLNYRKLTDAAINGRERLEYFLGSGHLGRTYLYSKNNYLVESPIAYYPDSKSYDMKPGLGKIDHMPGALPVNATCLRCHMSGTRMPQSGTEDRYDGLPFEHVGITCESCHGDTGSHVASRGKAPVVDPIKLEPSKRDSVCIVCHLEGSTSVERRGRTVLDFRPGDSIEHFVSYYVYKREKMNDRGVSEIEQFASSQCKRVSGAEMSCMNCHDPHRTPTPAERVDFYRGKCLTCHTQAKYATAHHSENPDCTSCHLPKTGAKNIAHVAWTDHRILQRPGEPGQATGNDAGSSDLEEFLSAGGSARDLALAYYNLAVNGNTPERARATELLTEASKASPDDSAVLRALGVLAEWNGDHDGAKKLYESVLTLEPDSLTATVNLGTLLARSGDYGGAAALWKPAFDRNEDILGLGENLASAECALGEKGLSITTLRRMLVYSPDIPRVREQFKAIESGETPCRGTAAALILQTP